LRPSISSRRQPAIFLVLAALWSAHALPAEISRQAGIKSLQIGRLATVSKASNAKVLLCRLSTEARSTRQRDLRRILAHLLALSPATLLASPRPIDPIQGGHNSPAVFSQPPAPLYQRPPPRTFLV